MLNTNHKSALKTSFYDFMNNPDFSEIEYHWDIDFKNINVPDRIRVFENNTDNELDDIEITPQYNVKALCFHLKVVGHINFDFCIYEDYENPDLVYFKPAVYYYGNYIKDFIYFKISGEGELCMPFRMYCWDLQRRGDNFANHNYKIDMETVDKFNLMR